MEWYELFDSENEPSTEQIKEYVNTPLFTDLDGYLQEAYKIKSKVAYSKCKMDAGMFRGWNIKYQKSSKTLCTLYPKSGYMLLLVTIGVRAVCEAEKILQSCTEYIQDLFKESDFHGSKYLVIELRDENVLRDVKNMIDIRARIK